MNKSTGKKAIVSMVMAASVFGLAGAPLTASAQSWNDNNGNRYNQNNRHWQDQQNRQRQDQNNRWNQNRGNRERQAWGYAQNRNPHRHVERTARWEDNRGENYRFRDNNGRIVIVIFARSGQVTVIVNN